MSDYTCTITQVTIHRQGDNPLSTPEATVVSLDDMGGGYFISIKQHAQGDEGCVVLDPDELPKLLEAAQLLLQSASYEPFAGRGLTADERAMCLEVIGSDRGNRAHQD
jgi:hypothetical protein